MSYDLLLLANWQVRLIIFIGTSPEILNSLSASQGLLVKVVRMSPALFNEILRQTQVATLMCDRVELYQGQFYLLMTGISTFLALLNAKNRRDIIRVTTGRVEQSAFAGTLKMSNRSLNQMPGTVEFMVIP